MLSEITASFSRNRCLWAEFTMPATNPGCKEEAMIHFLELGLYTHHYSLKFYINTLRLLSSFKCKFTFVNVKRKFEFCYFFGSPCALDGRVIGVFSGFILGQNILALVKLSVLPMTTLTSIGHINTKSESDVSQVLWILQSLTSVQLNSYGRFRIYVTALSSTIIKISNIKWIWFWKKIFQHSSRASETWTINAKVHWNSRWWILFNPEVWRSWQAREQCTTSTSFATHIIPDSFICDFLNRKKKKTK